MRFSSTGGCDRDQRYQDQARDEYRRINEAKHNKAHEKSTGTGQHDPGADPRRRRRFLPRAVRTLTEEFFSPPDEFTSSGVELA
jgi:hypothetical protein